MLHACIRLQMGFARIPYVCAGTFVPRNLDYVFLCFYLFSFICLALVWSVFPMFEIDSLTCFVLDE